MSHFYLQMDHSSDLLSVSNYLFKIFSSIYSSRTCKNQNSYFLSSRKIYIYILSGLEGMLRKKKFLFFQPITPTITLIYTLSFFTLRLLSHSHVHISQLILPTLPTLLYRSDTTIFIYVFIFFRNIFAPRISS